MGGLRQLALQKIEWESVIPIYDFGWIRIRTSIFAVAKMIMKHGFEENEPDL
jgi:hypothetical protein